MIRDKSGESYSQRRLARFARQAVALGIVGIGSTVLPLLLSVSWSRAWILVGSSVLIAVGTLVFLQLRWGTPQEVELRIALTGGPGVGKTVLVNLIFDRLMRSANSDIAITPEAATAIAVYQAIRNVTTSSWPSRTSGESVYRYIAEVRYAMRRDLIVGLEFGDTAGEHWLELGDRLRDPPHSETRESYVEYVISAGALVHVVACDSLTAPNQRAREVLKGEVSDLLVADQLRRAAKVSNAGQSLMLDISKCDLWIESVSESESRDTELWRELSAWVADGRIMSVEQLRISVESLRGEGWWYPFESRIGDALTAIVFAAEELLPHFASVVITFSSVSADRYRDSTAGTARLADHVLAWIREAAVRQVREVR
jgi:hypothetical protein